MWYYALLGRTHARYKRKFDSRLMSTRRFADGEVVFLQLEGARKSSNLGSIELAHSKICPRQPRPLQSNEERSW